MAVTLTGLDPRSSLHFELAPAQIEFERRLAHPQRRPQ
jgi:hypothetical protein